jgi:hypothetical protein
MTVVYGASPIKRTRATKAEVEERRDALYWIIAAGRPMTVRQVFYQATVQGLVEKTESGYTKVQTDLTVMRRAGDLPYDWLADNTRWQRKPHTFGSIEEALRDTAAFYRKNLWADADRYVEIWLEKDALAGVIYPVTSTFDVPLMVARGYASLSFLHTAAEHIGTLDVPAYIYHLGDFDPSGVNAGEKIEETLRELAPDADIVFERIAVTPRADRRLGPADAADQGERHAGKEFWHHLGRARRDRAESAAHARARDDRAAPPASAIRDAEGGGSIGARNHRPAGQDSHAKEAARVNSSPVIIEMDADARPATNEMPNGPSTLQIGTAHFRKRWRAGMRRGGAQGRPIGSVIAPGCTFARGAIPRQAGKTHPAPVAAFPAQPVGSLPAMRNGR